MKGFGVGRMVIGWLLCVSACVSSSSVECRDGSICPSGTTCRALTNPDDVVCATDGQLTACMGKSPLEACDPAGSGASRCYDEVCLPAGCGNRRIDPDEMCDDGNSTAGDGCSVDCTSDETCGNGVTDLVTLESCDDKNFLDHDGCTSRCQREDVSWRRRLASPPGRWGAGIAYDPLRDRVVMFGGYPVSATYEWDGQAWERWPGASPPGRQWPALAFDGSQIVMYGGNVGSSDTWTFDGASWTRVDDSGPGPRVGHRMAYDSARKVVVLFGGDATNTTWSWNGTAWSQVATAHAPPPRGSHMMTYDPHEGAVIVAGGGSAGSIRADTWKFDGTDWIDVTPASGASPARVLANLGYDESSQQLIATGGCDASATCASGDITTQLAWNGSTWTASTPAVAPPARADAAGVTAGSRFIVVGGTATDNTTLGDGWEYEGGQWSQVMTPGARSGMALVLDPARRRVVAFGGQDETLSYPPETWELSARGWKRFAVSGPNAADIVGMTYDPASGGVLALTAVNPSPLQTWLWRNGTWTHLTPATSPPWRVGPNLGVVAGHVYMLGTAGPPWLQREVWRWDGAAWMQLADLPTDVATGSLGTDLVRDQIVIHAGATTWTFDGTSFTSHASVQYPTTGGRFVWNAARARLWLASEDATWEWDGGSWSPVPVSLPTWMFNASFGSAVDGAGVVLYGSDRDPNTAKPYGEQMWELRWRGRTLAEVCSGPDHDGDGMAGCADPDCWSVCSPACPPATSCAATAPTCGDSDCSADVETCRTCPQDCPCAPVCGDLVCDAGETACPGDCP